MDRPSTSQGPPRKKGKSEVDNVRRIYTEEELRQILKENVSDGDLSFDESISSDDSEGENELSSALNEEPLQEERSMSQEDSNAVCSSQSSVSESNHPLSERIDVWRTTCPQVEKIHFEGEPGFINQPQGTRPIEFFNFLFTDSLIDMVVNESNAYASSLLDLQTSPKAFVKWKDITTADFKIFIGVIFLMGIIKLNRLKDYWRGDYLFQLPIAKFISRDKFMLILRALHFSLDTNVQDPLRKIRPVIDYFNNIMKENYYPSKNLSIDESMVLWRGRLSFRQYLTGKRHKYGMKLYVLAEPEGLVHKVHVYGGAKDVDVSGTGHTSKVVHKLLEGKLQVGHAVYMDNFYNSLELAKDLRAKKTYCTGTLRPNREGNPDAVTNAKLKKGESISRYDKMGICITKWKDKREVLAISSEFSGDMITTTNRRGNSVNKPQLIVEYNRYMRGVDSHDQMQAYYPWMHKTLRWYKKLGIHIFQMILINSWFLFNKRAAKKMDLHGYEIEVIKSLLPPPPTPPPIVPKFVIHFPQKIEKEPGKTTKRKRCIHCSTTKNVRRDSVYFCADCPNEPGLCLECFCEFHKYK